jgi:hypothetical protein
MAIASNDSSVEVGGGGIPLYCGVATVNVIAVNPTLGELHSLGINVKSEQNYTGILMGERVLNKLTFWVRNAEHEFTTRFDILVQPEERPESRTGKYQWINKFGQTAWGTENPSTQYEWFKNEGVRRSYVGEEMLIDFMRAWANVGRDGECAIDDIAAVTSGDVTELKQYVSSLKENRLRLLMGVKDDKYQTVYTKHFGREKPRRDDLFIKALNEDYGDFRAEYDPNDLTLKKWEPGVVQPNDTAASTESAEADVAADWI